MYWYNYQYNGHYNSMNQLNKINEKLYWYGFQLTINNKHYISEMYIIEKL